MTKLLPITLAMFCMAGSSCSGPTEPVLHQWIHINGTPRLILGMYEKVADDALLADLAVAGFNLVNTTDDPTRLDQLHRHGLYAWVNLGNDLALPQIDDTGQADGLATRVNRLKDHPAMLVWEGPDEPLWNIWYSRLRQYWNQRDAMKPALEKLKAPHHPELQALRKRSNDRHARGLLEEAESLQARFWECAGIPAPIEAVGWSEIRRRATEHGDALTRGFKLVKQLDPDGIRWINHAPRNSIVSLRHYNREVDMAGCDIYPIPLKPPSGHSDLLDQNPSSVGTYTRRMAAAAPGKSVAMILQGFAWADIGQSHEGGEVRPTFRQTRFMAYDALLNGAAVITWWGTHYIPKDSDLWHDILTTARELRALEPALVAPPLDATLQCRADETWGSHDGQGPTLMFRRTGNDYVLIALNATGHGIAFHVAGLPAMLEDKTFHRLGTRESHVVTDGSFADGIAAYDVHVYATSRHRFEVGTSAEIPVP